MVVELQSDTQGRIIPIESLRRLWSGMAEEGNRPPATNTVADCLPPGQRLSQILHTFDRKLQTTDFELALDDFWDFRRSPVVCAILGSEDDRPILCRDSCLQVTLRERLERMELGGKAPNQHQIDWPDPCARGGVPHALLRLRQQVRSELKASDASAEGIRNAYNAGVAPWAFFSFLKETEFTAQHRQMLLEWISFWREVGAEALNKPLAVLLIFQVEDPSRRDVLIERVFDEFGADLFDYVSPLSRLHEFPLHEVTDWLKHKARDIAISADDLDGRLIPDANQKLGGTPVLRLKAVESWLQTLQV
jgi:hypothetical protein